MIATIELTAAILIFIAAIPDMFGVILQVSVWGILLAIPIFVYEMTLSVWLIIRGFNLSELGN